MLELVERGILLDSHAVVDTSLKLSMGAFFLVASACLIGIRREASVSMRHLNSVCQSVDDICKSAKNGIVIPAGKVVKKINEKGGIELPGLGARICKNSSGHYHVLFKPDGLISL